MIHSVRVTRDGTTVRVGLRPAHPEQTALVEARGACLYWDVLAEPVMPVDPAGTVPRTMPVLPTAVDIHDPGIAAEWLWEIYGAGPAAAILTPGDGVRDVELPASEPERTPDDPRSAALGAARTLAFLTWAEAWWPASVVASVVPLDRSLLRAEKAVATAAIDHLLDDDAVERALTEAGIDPFVSRGSGAELARLVDDLLARLSELADDYGIEVRTEAESGATQDRADFALAAGGEAQPGGVTVMQGSAAVDWALVPQGVVDAAAEASWAVVRRRGASVLEVSVPSAPVSDPSPAARLAARFGPVDCPLDRSTATAAFTGSTPVPASVLLLPATQRALTVYAPNFAVADRLDPSSGVGADGYPDDQRVAARRASVVALARARLDSPSATLTERVAGSARGNRR